MITFSEALAEFRKKQPSPKRVVVKRQIRAAIALQSVDHMYAIPQPFLCREMPHNFAPFKGGTLCVRCGVTE